MIFDVAVVGAGPAGVVSALVLTRAGRRVALVDGGPSPTRRVGESLIGAARPLLRELGLLEIVQGGSHIPSYGNAFSWGSPEIVHTDFIHDPNGLGWHLDRSQFDRDLRSHARNREIRFHQGQVKKLSVEDDVWRLDGENFQIGAKWIVDATGRSSAVARKLEAIRTNDDSLMAVYAWTGPKSDDTDSRTLVEATQNGWWYTSRLPDLSRVVVFHTDSDRVGALVKSSEVWKRALRETVHIQKAIAMDSFIPELHCTQACGARLDRFAGENWLATGDSALSFDPLSSQGIFTALYSGMKAGQAVHRALSREAGTIAEYVNRLEGIRASYLENRQYVYSTERRWSESTFWKSKQT